MDKYKLNEILEKHKKWLNNEPGGERAILDGKNLSRASLDGASLDGALLNGASLNGASLNGASLDGASLDRASLDGAKIPIKLVNKFYPICCPEFGEFIAWKRCGKFIVKLKVTETAKRSSAFGRKCRCSEAVVLDIEPIQEGVDVPDFARSDYDKNFIYRKGAIVRVDNFDDDRTHECASGIHFFITRDEAINY